MKLGKAAVGTWRVICCSPLAFQVHVRQRLNDYLGSLLMATLSNKLAWKIPRMEEPGRYSPWGCQESDMTERLPISLPGRSHRWRSPAGTVRGVAKSRTWLSDFTFTFPGLSGNCVPFLSVFSCNNNQVKRPKCEMIVFSRIYLEHQGESSYSEWWKRLTVNRPCNWENLVQIVSVLYT